MVPGRPVRPGRFRRRSGTCKNGRVTAHSEFSIQKLVIIGGGPGGYEAALVAADHGADVTVVCNEGLGGNSVLWDCVPSKAMIVSAEAMGWLQSAHRLGVQVADFLA